MPENITYNKYIASCSCLCSCSRAQWKWRSLAAMYQTSCQYSQAFIHSFIYHKYFESQVGHRYSFLQHTANNRLQLNRLQQQHKRLTNWFFTISTIQMHSIAKMCTFINKAICNSKKMQKRQNNSNSSSKIFNLLPIFCRQSW